MPRGVGQQIRQDAVEHEPVDDGREVVRATSSVNGVPSATAPRTISLERLCGRRAASGRPDDAGVEPREVEELFEQPPQPLALLDARAQELLPDVGARASLSRWASVVRTPYTEAAGVRSSCDAIATKFALSWSSMQDLLVEACALDRERDA